MVSPDNFETRPSREPLAVPPEISPPEIQLLEAIFGKREDEPLFFSSEQLRELREETDKALGTLTERQQGVLRLRFGLPEGGGRTRKQIASEYKVTPERVRQIEIKAIRRLCHPSRSRRLLAFFPPEGREKIGLFPPPEPEPEEKPYDFENRLLAEVELSEEQRRKLSLVPIKDLNLSPRVNNLLLNQLIPPYPEGVSDDFGDWTAWQDREIKKITIGRILSMSSEDLLRLSQFGPVALEELKQKIRDFQLPKFFLRC